VPESYRIGREGHREKMRRIAAEIQEDLHL
jgi:hypothetical protein